MPCQWATWFFFFCVQIDSGSDKGSKMQVILAVVCVCVMDFTVQLNGHDTNEVICQTKVTLQPPSAQGAVDRETACAIVDYENYFVWY